MDLWSMVIGFVRQGFALGVMEKLPILSNSIQNKIPSDGDFRAAVDRYMTFYNEVRPHVKNACKTPLAKEQEYYSNQGIAEED